MKVWVWKDNEYIMTSKKKPKINSEYGLDTWSSHGDEEELYKTGMGKLFKGVKEEPQQYEVTATMLPRLAGWPKRKG